MAASVIGEVQGTSCYAEMPGNLVLTAATDLAQFRELAIQGSETILCSGCNSVTLGRLLTSQQAILKGQVHSIFLAFAVSS